MSITIKDIAIKAGVSHMTVSRAMNNSPLVNEKTRERIQKIAKELNYTPNLNARSLVLSKSYNIGLFFTSIKHGTAPEFFYEITEVVNDIIKDDYNLVIRSIEDMSNFDNVNSRHFDGIILLSQSDSDDAFIQNIISKSIPLVCLNRKVVDAPCVYTDDSLGAYMSVNHLIDRGCFTIGLIEGTSHFSSTTLRRKGVLKALSENNMTLNHDFVRDGEYSHKGGYSAMCSLIKSGNVPDGLFCYNDDMAIGAMRALNESGLRTPADILICGFDGSSIAKYIYPSLTTIRRPIRKASKAGTLMLLDIINGKNHNEKIVLDPEIIIREST